MGTQTGPGTAAGLLVPIRSVSAAQRVSHSELALHTQGCAYPIPLPSRPWNAEVHIFPIQQGKTAFQSQSARNVALFLFLTELPGTHYGAVRDVYLAMATRASSRPCATAHVTSDKQKNSRPPLLSPLKKMADSVSVTNTERVCGEKKHKGTKPLHLMGGTLDGRALTG